MTHAQRKSSQAKPSHHALPQTSNLSETDGDRQLQSRPFAQPVQQETAVENVSSAPSAPADLAYDWTKVSILPKAETAGAISPPAALHISNSPGNLVQADKSDKEKTVTVGSEKVDISSPEELFEATRIIQSIKDTYGIDVSSQAGVDAIKQDYTSAPKDVRDSLKTKQWKLKELKALEQALKHFSPILGDKRAKSSRSGTDQEITSASKVDQAIDEDSVDGELDTTTLGEYFESSKNFSMFSAGTNSTVDFKDNDKQLEGTAVHEIAHGLLEYAIGDYVSTLDYWLDKNTASGKAGAEAPITDYGKTNASEDLSEAAMYFFVEPATLKKKCPERYNFLTKTVAAWKPKKSE